MFRRLGEILEKFLDCTSLRREFVRDSARVEIQLGDTCTYST
jgi:hypothetical protein